MLRQCKVCHSTHELSKFPQFKYKGLYRYRSVCQQCHGVKKMLADACYRANQAGHEFSLVPSDIVIPDVCPILKINLDWTSSDVNTSPSLDRIDSSRGYVRDNVQVISTRANYLKRDATLDELNMLGMWAFNLQLATMFPDEVPQEDF